MRSLSFFTAALAAIALVASAGRAEAQTLNSELGQRYDFTSDGSMSDGTSDSYDGCYYLTVGGTTYRPTGASTLSGRTITFPVQVISGLNVSRITYVPMTGGEWARYLEILQNPGTTAVTVDVTINGNLGSDSSTSLRASSTGDTLFSTADDWLTTNDTSSCCDPALGHVVQGPGAPSRTTVATLSGDSLSWTFHLTIGAGARAVLMWFAIQRGDTDEAGAQSTATALIPLPAAATSGADAYLPDVKNFLTLAPCAGADGSACTGTTGSAGFCHAALCCTGCWDGMSCHGTGSPCDDGNYCTATDTCTGLNVCSGMGSPCDDGNPCNTDTCTEATDSCAHANLPDLTACPMGLCHSAICCTGCWDGTSCQPGFYPATCGAGGASCASCIDADSCTDNICSAGACSNPLSFAGTPCDDGNYCTSGDTCDGADVCRSGPGSPCNDGAFCTTDTCDEATDTCMYAAAPDTCAIFGSCFMGGDRNPSNRCQACDPATDTHAWTIAVGMDCGAAICAGAMITPAPTCSATGVCTPSTRMPCPDGRCADTTTCASGCTTDAECGASGWCDATTMMCAGRVASGMPCTRNEMCAIGACSPEGVCCASACAGTCVSCALPGNVGRCLPIAAGMDPNDECPGAGTCNGSAACGATPDMGIVATDGGGPGTDGGGPGTDGGTGADAQPDAGGMTGGGGCCGVAGAGGDGATLAVLAGLAALVVTRRRRR